MLEEKKIGSHGFRSQFKYRILSTIRCTFNPLFAKIDLAAALNPFVIANWALPKQHVPNHIFRDEVLFSLGQRSFSLLVEAEAEAVVVEAEAEAEAVED